MFVNGMYLFFGLLAGYFLLHVAVGLFFWSLLLYGKMCEALSEVFAYVGRLVGPDYGKREDARRKRLGY